MTKAGRRGGLQKAPGPRWGMVLDPDPSPESRCGSWLPAPTLARLRPLPGLLPARPPRLAPGRAPGRRPVRQGPPHRHQLAARRRRRPRLRRPLLLPGRAGPPRRAAGGPAAALVPAPPARRGAGPVRPGRQPENLVEANYGTFDGWERVQGILATVRSDEKVRKVRETTHLKLLRTRVKPVRRSAGQGGG